MIIKDTIESLQSQTYHMYYIAFTMWLFKWIYIVWNVIDMQIKLNLKPSHTGKEKSWAWDLNFLNSLFTKYYHIEIEEENFEKWMVKAPTNVRSEWWKHQLVGI